MKTKEKVRSFCIRYKHALLPLIYGLFYFKIFTLLEESITSDFYVVHMKIDDYIPFCEYFVIPYFLWFFYIAATVLLFIFGPKADFYKLCIMLGSGMTLFLIVSFLIPNGHLLRPTSFARDNIFVSMVKALYQKDTSTNIFPSIHCYNSIVAHIAISKSTKFSNIKWLKHSSLVLCISIVLSTMFIKQHSFFDVLTAIILAIIMYLFVYKKGVEVN